MSGILTCSDVFRVVVVDEDSRMAPPRREDHVPADLIGRCQTQLTDVSASSNKHQTHNGRYSLYSCARTIQSQHLQPTPPDTPSPLAVYFPSLCIEAVPTTLVRSQSAFCSLGRHQAAVLFTETMRHPSVYSKEAMNSSDPQTICRNFNSYDHRR